jgi:hypothetical protein
MVTISEGSSLWQYLSPPQRGLASDGQFLLADSEQHRETHVADYSYLVFPFAKLYEGFLKQLFFDLGFIPEKEYYGDHFRIGKALSPNLASVLGERSIFRQIETRYGSDLAIQLWGTWKNGRNLVFHYFPHNYRALSREQAIEIVQELVSVMHDAVERTHVPIHSHRPRD